MKQNIASSNASDVRAAQGSNTTSKFEPTPVMISAAQAVFMAMANMQLIEPVVRAYQAEILLKGQWYTKDLLTGRLNRELVTDPKQSYLMAEEDFAEYDRLCKQARVAAELKVSQPENCPLLEAETLLSVTQNALIDTMKPVTKIDSQTILNLGMDKRNTLIEMTLRLLAPFVPNPLPNLAKG